MKIYKSIVDQKEKGVKHLFTFYLDFKITLELESSTDSTNRGVVVYTVV